MQVHDALVVGAGPAGLAVSRELTRGGVEHLVLEKGEQVGQTWAHLYDSLVLHTTRHLSALPGLPLPARLPRFLPRLDFLAYLTDYARTFQVPVRTGTQVVDLRHDSKLWLVRTMTGDAFAAHSVVLATGVVSNPYVPFLEGRDQFNGRILHAVDYRRPQPFVGQRVLVVGAGNSAADISLDLAEAGVNVTLSARSGPTIVPIELAGVPIQYLGFVLAPLQSVLQKASLVRCPRVPVIGRELATALRSGAVRRKGAIASLTVEGARFENGGTLPVDALILATGFRAAVGCLPSVRLDSCGFPERRGRVASRDCPNLFFVGHRYGPSGALYNIGRDATLAAGLVKSALDGRRQKPTETQQPLSGK